MIHLQGSCLWLSVLWHCWIGTGRTPFPIILLLRFIGLYPGESGLAGSLSWFSSSACSRGEPEWYASCKNHFHSLQETGELWVPMAKAD